MQPAGFLEFQRRLAGDRKARPSPQHIERLRAGQPPRQRRPVQRQGLCKSLRQSGDGGFQGCVLLPFGQQGKGRQHAGHEGLGGGHAFFLACLQGKAMGRGLRHRRIGEIGDRNGQCPARPGGAHHFHNVGTAARLRNSDAGRPFQPQGPPVDRRDRRPDRGHGNPRQQFRGIFEIGRRMIGRSPRHGHEQGRIQHAQGSRSCSHGPGRPIQKPGSGLGNLGDLIGHEAGRHDGVLSLSGASLSSTAKS